VSHSRSLTITTLPYRQHRGDQVLATVSCSYPYELQLLRLLQQLSNTGDKSTGSAAIKDTVVEAQG
jgi:hypothetical protein